MNVQFITGKKVIALEQRLSSRTPAPPETQIREVWGGGPRIGTADEFPGAAAAATTGQGNHTLRITALERLSSLHPLSPKEGQAFLQNTQIITWPGLSLFFLLLQIRESIRPTLLSVMLMAFPGESSYCYQPRSLSLQGLHPRGVAVKTGDEMRSKEPFLAKAILNTRFQTLHPEGWVSLSVICSNYSRKLTQGL